VDGMSTRERAVIDEQIETGTTAINFITTHGFGDVADWHAFLTEFTRQMFRDLENLREDEAWDAHEQRKLTEPAE
jgi:hypothetical protein